MTAGKLARTSLRAGFVMLAMLVFGSALPAQRIEIAWPTANRAYAERRPLEDFIQPTVSGEVISGLFGCVRTQGRQFHEGIDLKPISRDRRGEATDEIFAVLPGIVRHINRTAGDSSYGRYIVLEHTDQSLPVYTLYAHLASIADGLKTGDTVARAQVIGIMGRSAGGYTIPKDRAHLHFEIGLRLTDDFQSWYDWKKFGSRNEHGIWNGMNLVGVDALEFYSLFRDRRVDGFDDYFRQLPEALRLRIATTHTPDFIRRYPSLRRGADTDKSPAGWEVAFNSFGVPFAWTPLAASELDGYKPNEVRIVSTNDDALRACRCKDLTRTSRNRTLPDRDLQTVLQLIFGLR